MTCGTMIKNATFKSGDICLSALIQNVLNFVKFLLSVWAFWLEVRASEALFLSPDVAAAPLALAAATV